VFIVLAKIDGCSADAALTCFSRILDRIDAQFRLSITCDCGREKAKHEQLTAKIGVKAYFADHHAPWQRGANENTNRLIRQYLPKGEVLTQYSQEQLDQFAWLLNSTPRKSLSWKCLAELYVPAFDSWNTTRGSLHCEPESSPSILFSRGSIRSWRLLKPVLEGETSPLQHQRMVTSELLHSESVSALLRTLVAGNCSTVPWPATSAVKPWADCPGLATAHERA